jgi:uncharacterized MAPEG superfamily protein
MIHEVLTPYATTITTTGAVGGLMLIQLLVADMIGITSRHIPGTPVEADHKNKLFRAVRALANTNESVSIFILLAMFSIAVAASPAWINGLALTYLGGRVGHMVCYYLNIKLMRSISFAVSLIALLGLFTVSGAAWLSLP